MDHLLKVLLLLCSSGAEGKYTSPGARCETEDKADIVLLMDDSGSISASTFKIMKDFFKRIVGAFDIGPDKVQIGLVRYSSFGQTVWNLNTYQTKQSVLEAVDQLIQTGGDTMTGRALKYILHTSFKPNAGMRADSQKIAVLITDGESLDDTLLPSQDLKDTGIEVYTIDPAVSSIRLILLPLALLTFITAVCFVHKTTRGQNPGPQENMELDYHKAGVCGAEGGLAEEEGAQAAE